MKNFLLSITLICFTVFAFSKQVNTMGPEQDLNAIKTADVIKDVPVEADFYNDCCGEWVHVSGTAMFLFTNNILHAVVKDLTGVGASTNSSYTAKGASIENIIKPNDPDNGSHLLKLNMTNKNGCSFKLKIHFHLTTNANGIQTVVIEKIETECEK